jgi:hypothetical protein
MGAFAFEPVTLPRGIGKLRSAVRDFVQHELPDLGAARPTNSWWVCDAACHSKLRHYGWHDRKKRCERRRR